MKYVDAEEFLRLELTEDSTKEHMMPTHAVAGPPDSATGGKGGQEAGRGSECTTTVIKLCSNKKLPSGAP